MSGAERFRLLPSVDELASRIAGPYPRALVVRECRQAIEGMRERLKQGHAMENLEAAVEARLQRLATPSLRTVINATGVILHTNLGRAPLCATPGVGWYSNLEYDLETGRRGKRDTHLGPLFERLLGVPAIAVNNGAAAVFLALQELAGAGEVVISRGELIEIGDGFRIPDIMLRSGARLVEVGTTNRTRIGDYRAAITENTKLLLRVHPSNFRMEGFTGRPELEELCALGREFGIPVYEDLGSGCVVDLKPHGVAEPLVAESFKAGVDLVSFSGDKLMGGPQAGVLAGRAELVQRLRANPLFRALRLDKLLVGQLEATLRALVLERFDEIPVLRMLRTPLEELRRRAERLAEGIDDALVEPAESLLGGGSTPEQTLPTWVVSIGVNAVELERRLRLGDPAVLGRMVNGRLLLDPRTVQPEQDAMLRRALRRAE